ncbi:50S ribosomal protein L25, partial [bacterium]|nr:50S ribosomal protein L25 [bacterium]
GKGPAKRLRAEGKIPAIFYGHGGESIPLTIDAKMFHNILHTHAAENIIFDVKIPGQKNPFKAIIREVQHHPVRGDILHLDFLHISMKKKLHVSVPIVLVGSPVGVSTKGGVLQHILHELEIECLPGEIPEHIEVDVTELDVGDSIHIRDLSLEKLNILTEVQRSIATVVPPTVIKAPVVEEEELVEEEGLEEPELIEKERKEEEGEEGKKEEEQK